MLRADVSPEDWERLRERGRSPWATPWERDRVEMILLSASGWSPPWIAEYLGVHAATVRRVLKAWSREGLDALERKLPGPVPDVERHARVVGLLEKLLSEPRIWTSAQLAEALAGVGIRMSARQTERYLGATVGRSGAVASSLPMRPPRVGEPTHWSPTASATDNGPFVSP